MLPRFAEFDPRPAQAPPLAGADGFIVRPGASGDVPALAALSAARGGSLVSESSRAFRDQLEAGAAGVGHLLVADLSGEIIAFGKTRRFTAPGDAPANLCPDGWYLTGLIVAPRHRRRGVATLLTAARLRWIAERAEEAYYFANSMNRVSIDLHRRFGFEEVTRDFAYPGVTFTNGAGILFRASLAMGAAGKKPGSRDRW
ncbi:MAG: GNAT family N-acetyltransferase [Candidatus Eisenbacteria bacterium]|nr:GNAT family N-acetyltransferase [Candidatus Eisenbacteria bacterium]